MLKLFVTAALRNLLRHKVQALINIASLALGLTVFGFAFLYVKQELSYDKGWPEGERVHRLTLEQRGFPGLPDRSYAAALARSYVRLMDRFGAEFAAATRTMSTGVHIADTENQPISIWFVDPAFVDILQPQVLEGDLARAVSSPGFVAVDENFADSHGLHGRVGERITLAGYGNGEVEYELAAIYRLPAPMSPVAEFQLFTLMHNYSLPLFGNGQNVPTTGPWDNQISVWVKLREGLGTAEFNAMMPEYIQQTIHDYDEALGPERKVSDHLFYHWQAVTELHFNPLSTETFAGAGFGDMSRVVTFAAVGLLVLLVGCSNSISLSLAAAIERRREVGVRKAAGALPRDILWQRLGEAVLLALLALIPAIATLELLLPTFQTLLPFVEVDAGLGEYLLLAGIAVLVGLACGAYPAFVLASIRPQLVLRSGAQGKAGGGARLRTLLVGVQFFFASILLIGMAALYVQLSVARAQPLGFDANNVLVLYQNAPSAGFPALRTELAKLPGVVSVVPASLPPNAGLPPTANTANFTRSAGGGNEVALQRQRVDFDFVELMGMRLLAGRDFDLSRDNRDVSTGAFEGGTERVMLNASAARALGFAAPEQAIDQPLFNRLLNNVTGETREVPMQIIGVVEDTLYASVRQRPIPEVYIVIPNLPGQVTSNMLMLKYEDAAEATLQERITQTADQVLGAPLSGIIFAEQEISSAFQQEQNESRLLLICGALALLLASFGLYGLAAFAIERQVKEVGIRKAMGAQVASIVGLYLWRFGRPILLANLLAWPVASYFLLQWIERFPYQMERAWLAPLCIGTLGAVLLIAMLTVSIITTRAAAANPVRSLRYE